MRTSLWMGCGVVLTPPPPTQSDAGSDDEAMAMAITPEAKKKPAPAKKPAAVAAKKMAVVDDSDDDEAVVMTTPLAVKKTVARAVVDGEIRPPLPQLFTTLPCCVWTGTSRRFTVHRSLCPEREIVCTWWSHTGDGNAPAFKSPMRSADAIQLPCFARQCLSGWAC
jgi:hypothetical protein